MPQYEAITNIYHSELYSSISNGYLFTKYTLLGGNVSFGLMKEATQRAKQALDAEFDRF